MTDASKDKTTGMKSAYELALERLERQGIERPRQEALDEETRAEMAEARRKAEADLAQLVILHRDRLRKLADPAARAEEEEDYRRELRRIEDERERKLEKLRRRAKG